jgi:hypothetical protein
MANKYFPEFLKITSNISEKDWMWAIVDIDRPVRFPGRLSLIKIREYSGLNCKFGGRANEQKVLSDIAY